MMDRNEILNDPETAQRYALQGLQSQMWTAFPAIVSNVNLSAMTVDCTCAIKGKIENSDGSTTYQPITLLTDVPICFPSAGGFSLTLPIAPGDEVLVVIASRCIDAWWQNGGIQNPMEFRMHDLSDGFAIPGPRSQPRVVTGISAANARLVNDAGTVYLEITPGGAVNIVAPSGLTVTGNLNVTGEINATETIESDVDVTAQGISLVNHKHKGVTTGTDNTGDAFG